MSINHVAGGAIAQDDKLQPQRITGWRAAIPAAVIVLLGIAAVILATSWGVGVSPDSIAYIAGARSLLAGDGFSMPGAVPIPITHFPPFYSLALAAGGVAGLDPMVGARWLGVLTLAGNILLVGWIVARLDQQRGFVPGVLPLTAMLLMLVSATMLEIHVMAWSEPMFILLGLSGFVLLTRWLEGGRFSFLVLSAIVIGLAFTTRYAGVAYVGTAFLAVILFGRGTLARRSSAAVTFGLIAALPMLAWVLRNVALAGTTTNRSLYPHMPSVTLLWEALATFSSWILLPNALPTVVRGLVLAACAAAVGLLYALALRNESTSGRQVESRSARFPMILWLLGLYIPVYGATLFFSNSVLRAYTPMEGRILSPLYAPLLIFVLYGCQRYLATTQRGQFARFLFASVALVFVAVSLVRSAATIRQAYAEGVGFNSRLWHESDILQRLETFPATKTLFSNAPEAIYTHLNNLAAKIPRPVESATGLPDPDYPAEFALMQREIEDGALVVLFDLSWRDVTSYTELIGELGLQPVAEADDGTIYAVEGFASEATGNR